MKLAPDQRQVISAVIGDAHAENVDAAGHFTSRAVALSALAELHDLEAGMGTGKP